VAFCNRNRSRLTRAVPAGPVTSVPVGERADAPGNPRPRFRDPGGSMHL